VAGSIAKRDNGSWRARYRDSSGREHSKSFGRKVDASTWLTQQTSAVQAGTHAAPAAGRMTVGEFATTKWLPAQSQLKASTRHRYESLLRGQVLPRWGAVPLSKVAHEDVSVWVADLLTSGGRNGRPLAASTVRQAHRVFSLVLTYAVRGGRLGRNVADHVPLPRAARLDKRFLTRAEVADLAAAAGHPGGLVIRTLALTGLRFGELSALRAGRVDLLRRRLEVAESVGEVNGTLVFGTPKTHARRSVPVPAELVDELAGLLAGRGPRDLVFTAPDGGVLRLNNYRSRVFDPAVKAVGLTGLTPHGLRHTAASLAVESGANVKAVQRMLGHASAAMTLDVYAGLFDDDLDGLLARMDAAAEAAAANLRPVAPVSSLAARTAGR
jgi:integrase